MEARARVIWDASQRCADLQYATSFWVTDPIVWVAWRDRTHLLVRDLEIERAGAEATVDEVVSLSSWDGAEPEGDLPRPVRAPVAFLLDAGVRSVEVHPDTPVRLVDALRKTTLEVVVGPTPFFPARARKREDEVSAIAEAEAAAERAVGIVEHILWDARREEGILKLAGEPLTSERVRREIEVALFADGFHMEHTIVSCGRASAIPHDHGSGPLQANVPIVVDVFPRSVATGYYGDLTRTFVKGRPSPGIVRMYDAVRAAHAAALERMHPGTLLRDVHEIVAETLRSRGFENRVEAGRSEGFIHGTGHGVGLEIHEPPTLGRVDADTSLEAGNVVTVEPGLYYHDEGGVRLEDLVHVTASGPVLLSKLPRDLTVIP